MKTVRSSMRDQESLRNKILILADYAYWGYGSNCNRDALAKYLVSQNIDPSRIRDCRKAVLKGYRLTTNYATLSGTGAANIEPDPHSSVEGLLMRITPDVHMALRRKEGFPVRYVETLVEVSVPSLRRRAMALTYVVSSACRLTCDLPVTPEYRETILAGGRANGFTKRYQRKLERILQCRKEQVR